MSVVMFAEVPEVSPVLCMRDKHTVFTSTRRMLSMGGGNGRQPYPAYTAPALSAAVQRSTSSRSVRR